MGHSRGFRRANSTSQLPRTVLTAVIPIQVGKEGVVGPGVEILQKFDFGETMGKPLRDSLMEEELTGVSGGVDGSHQQAQKEDLDWSTNKKILSEQLL